MKIICIGRNYRDHALELNNAIPEEPVIFMKPETALLLPGNSLPLPDFSAEIHHEIEIVLRVASDIKMIAGTSSADEYDPANETKLLYCIDAITVGIDLTARDLQKELKSKGLPWEKAKAFDNSAVIGQWKPVPSDLTDLSMVLKINDQVRQQGHCRDMLFDFSSILHHTLRYFSLRTGDLIFTGTPAGVGPVYSGDRLVGLLNGEKLLDLICQ